MTSQRRRSKHAREPRTDPVTTPIDAPPGWVAQRYRGRESGPDYTCPRCHRPVSRSSEHVVAWPADEDDGHRHWHKACWTSAAKEGVDRYRWG